MRLSKSEGPVTVYLKATQYKNGKSMYSEVNAQLNNEIVRAV